MCRTERRSGTCIWPHFLVCTNQLHSVQFSAFFRHPKIAIRVILAVGVLPKTPNKGWYCLDPSVLRERFFAAWGDASRPEVEGRGRSLTPTFKYLARSILSTYGSSSSMFNVMRSETSTGSLRLVRKVRPPEIWGTNAPWPSSPTPIGKDVS